MCGIAGFVGRGGRDTIEKMTDSLVRRGPDGRGFFVRDNVFLGHRRLSIIDIETGAQPMLSKDKSIAIIFNGEIYNFKDLKNTLKNKYNFETKSDTEVILNGYLEWGEAVFEKMEGMFAVAIYDFRENKLVLARDRMGKKPLYWCIFEDTFIFGSELKSLAGHPSFKKEIDLGSVNKYLMYEYVPTPHTIFKNVYKLEPATCLTYQNKKVEKKKFWRPDFTPQKISLDEACGQLNKALEASTKSRLVSDVPLGIFLSGGLDSSTIAYYAQKNSKEKIKTFSIGFEEKSFDESEYAQKVAGFLGTEHHSKIFSPKEVMDLAPQIGDVLDEPLADASILPMLLLSKFTKEKVTVALGGDGGDELLAGYPTFQAEQLFRLYGKIPKVAGNQIARVINNLPARDSNFSLDFKLKKFIEGVSEDKKHRHQAWLGSFSREERSRLFKREVWQELENKNEYEETDKYFKEVENYDFESQLLYMYMRTYMMDGVLVKVDRASMFHSLEVRAPFLSYDVVDLVNSFPYDFKYKNFKTKYVLKKLMEDKLPKEIVYRKKKGFGIPLAKWLKGDLKNFCNEVLSEGKIKETGLFNLEYVEQLKEEHFSGKKDNRKKLWTLIIFQMWYDKWA